MVISTKKLLQFINRNLGTNSKKIASKFYDGDEYAASMNLKALRDFFFFIPGETTTSHSTDMGLGIIQITTLNDIYLNAKGEEFLAESRRDLFQFWIPVLISIFALLYSLFGPSIQNIRLEPLQAPIPVKIEQK